MKKHTLTASIREVVGKKVKQLRLQGQIPATIYGKGLKSVSITLVTENFSKVLKEAGKAGLIEITIAGKIHPVLIHDVQVHPVTDEILHIEFYQVDMKEKVHAKVSIDHVGESAAVAQKLGVFLIIHDAVEVEALPAELPEKLTVDISSLVDVNQEISASQIKMPSGVTLLTDPATILMKIGPLVTKEAEAQATVEATEASEAAADAGTTDKPVETGSAPQESSEKSPEKK